MDNQSRVMAAMRAIDEHRDAALSKGENDKSSVIDLLTNLRHYCKAKGIDFSDAQRQSRVRFEAEH